MSRWGWSPPSCTESCPSGPRAFVAPPRDGRTAGPTIFGPTGASPSVSLSRRSERPEPRPGWRLAGGAWLRLIEALGTCRGRTRLRPCRRGKGEKHRDECAKPAFDGPRTNVKPVARPSMKYAGNMPTLEPGSSIEPRACVVSKPTTTQTTTPTAEARTQRRRLGCSATSSAARSRFAGSVMPDRIRKSRRGPEAGRRLCQFPRRMCHTDGGRRTTVGAIGQCPTEKTPLVIGNERGRGPSTMP